MAGMHSLSNMGYEIYAIARNENLRHPQQEVYGINYKFISTFSHSSQLAHYINDIDPCIIYVSGWMEKIYLKALFSITVKPVVVCGCDTQWKGVMKQRIASYFAPFLLHKIIDYMWVPGYRQYEFARRLNFDHNHILKNLYSADTKLFDNPKFIAEKAHEKFPKNFIYVGRISVEKGTDLLIKSFLKAKEITGSEWQLNIVGSYENAEVIDNPSINYYGYMSQTELVAQSRIFGVFCLPSRYEPWGVVLHEFSILGFPILCSNACGASDQFLIHGHNGFKFNSFDDSELIDYIMKFMKMTDQELKLMSKRSNKVGSTVDTSMWVASLLSVI